ncbi:MAG: ABC transporter ATP-binding protein [Aureispira sp.]|nr:ABC transporter ATP-binding protein [Aureispira sp.]
MDNKQVLIANKINKYFWKPQKFHVLKDISFSINSGEFVSVMGKSGCGKSTLLYVLSTMDTDYEGELILDGQTLTGKPNQDLAKARNEKIGFVFQFHYLLQEFSVLQNVMLPALKLGKLSKQEIEHNAYEKLKLLNIEDQALKKSSRLSGGQKQRVAIARALINDPMIIMGDEPTGNLDSKNAQNVFEIFQRLKEEQNQSLLIVTHDLDFAQKTDRIIEMLDGRIISHGYK